MENIDTIIDGPLRSARNFANGILIDLSLRKILSSMDELDRIKVDAEKSGDTLTIKDCEVGKAFFEKSIISLIEDRHALKYDDTYSS